MSRDNTPLFPAGYGCGEPMIKGSGQRPHAAEAAYDAIGDGLSVVHTHTVHAVRMDVNVEPVSILSADGGMTNNATIGEALRLLRERSGLSLPKLAEAMGYPAASSIQRYFDPAYDPPGKLPVAKAREFASALIGRGDPPITPDEVFALADIPDLATSSSDVETMAIDRKNLPGIQEMPRNIPVYGTALGAPLQLTSLREGNGMVAVEQTELNTGDTIDYFRRPPMLEGRKDIYGIYVYGESMWPRFKPGDKALVDPKRPPSIGDDVVVQIRGNGDDTQTDSVVSVLIKTLVRRSGSFVELEQYNPPALFRVETANIARMHRVIPMSELLG